MARRLRRAAALIPMLAALAAVAATPADNRPDGVDAAQSPAPPAVPGPAAGVQTRRVTHAGSDWFVVVVDPRVARLELVGQTLGPSAVRTFAGLEHWLARRGRRLVMATNAGLFHATHRPVGLHVEDGATLSPVDRGTGVGNFWLKPNGVFALSAGRAHIVPTDDWPSAAFAEAPPRIAVQSGPLVLHAGRIHPAFDPASPSMRVRSAVGVCGERIAFALSAGPVRFHDLATLYRDALGCPSALYLDGGISGLRAPAVPVDRSTGPYSYAGFLLVSAPAAPAPPPPRSDR